MLFSCTAFTQGPGQGLFTIDVLTTAGGFNTDEGVPVVWCGDDDRVDIVAGEQLAVVFVGCAGRIAVVIIDFFLAGIQTMPTTPILIRLLGAVWPSAPMATDGIMYGAARVAPTPPRNFLRDMVIAWFLRELFDEFKGMVRQFHDYRRQTRGCKTETVDRRIRVWRYTAPGR